MDYPLLYGVISGQRLCAGAPVLGERISVPEPVRIETVDAIKPRQRRGTVVLADAESLNGRRFSPRFVELCKVPGNSVWLIETIERTDDILDAFLPGLAKLVIPVYGIESEDVLKEAVEISDDCIPLVEIRKGKALGREKDPLGAVIRLAGIGYRKVMVADLDGCMPGGFWDDASAKASVVSYVPGQRRLTDDVLTDVLGIRD
jgi:hypothetical protein